jgi:hypothetical protein
MRLRWTLALVTLGVLCGGARPCLGGEPSKLRILSAQESQPLTPPDEAVAPAVEELPPAEPPRVLPPSDAWALKPISSVTLNTAAPKGDFPENVAAPYIAEAGEYTDQSNLESAGWSYAYYWQASAFCHGPLYFEEVNLERYGYNCGLLQPAASAAHFFCTIPTLPYQMTVNPPGSCIYTLGQGRPGSYTPFQIHRPPLRWDAAVMQGAVVTGLVFLIP